MDPQRGAIRCLKEGRVGVDLAREGEGLGGRKKSGMTREEEWAPTWSTWICHCQRHKGGRPPSTGKTQGQLDRMTGVGPTKGNQP